MSGPSYRAAAQRLAALLADAPGPARAAELLEQLASGAVGEDAAARGAPMDREPA